MEIEENIQWHPAFCSAMELELRPYKKYLRYEREHNLGKMPLKIDFLVIRKDADIRIENDIADFFLRTNIFEYKSPGDSIDIGTFYKALAYSFLYKSEDEKAIESLDMDMTVSIVREEKPKKLLTQLGKKYSIVQSAPGIYRIGGLMLPMQFVVAKELDKEAHVWISSLTRTMKAENVHSLLDSYSGLRDYDDRENAKSLMNVASEANVKLFKSMIQEGDYMCQELREALEPYIIQLEVKIKEKDVTIANQATENAKKDAEIIRLRKLLADKGVDV